MSCRPWKLKIEQELDDSGNIDLITQEHLRNCPECRAYHQKLLQLNEMLETSVSHAFSGTHIQQLMTVAAESVSRLEYPAADTGNTRYSSSPFRRGVWAASCAAAAFIIAAAWLLHGPTQYTPTQPGTDLASAASSLSFNFSTAALVSLPEKPIRSEMKQLLADARRASAFLIQLMPSEPAPSAASVPTEEDK